ncbi:MULTISPECIES: hypothetical protein [unclassified Kitasatospora]|uniref:hypothetical protein n=1 Tax=unclassified Kitasatospora TaxID=2633591 RepID=UPI003827F732
MRLPVDRTHAQYQAVCRDALAVQHRLPAIMDELQLSRSEQGTAWRWLEAAYHCIGGGLAWQLETRRYDTPTGPVDIPVPGLNPVPELNPDPAEA